MYKQNSIWEGWWIGVRDKDVSYSISTKPEEESYKKKQCQEYEEVGSDINSIISSHLSCISLLILISC